MMFAARSPIGTEQARNKKLKIGGKTGLIPLLRRITAAKVAMAKNCPCSRPVPGKHRPLP